MKKCIVIIKKHWCIALTAIVFIWTLSEWIISGADTDILWLSILNYGLLFPVCGIILGIHYGRSQSGLKWIVPLCTFLVVMIHDISVGYILFEKVEFDPGQIPMYLVTAVPCLISEIITHIAAAVSNKRKFNQTEDS
ncbi:MAG: hypothetical protein K5629_00555 [Eubacteriales bacterium]|nr:hypothetical protein [Eubacteriales bacterium]